MYKVMIMVLFAWFVNVMLYADAWNSPHDPEKVQHETLFAAFSTPPKRLDPVVSYNANEWAIIGQVYEPPLQYNYLKRPYTLEPLTLTKMPSIRYVDGKGNEVDENAKEVQFSEYRLELREDVYFQDHPSFVKNDKGDLLYNNLSAEYLKDIHLLDDFEKTATRRLLAADYAYAIKRMAVRENHSPVLDNMSEYIVGLKIFSQKISKIAKEKKQKNIWLDLRRYDISGVKVLDDNTLTIKIKGKYPQFM